MSSGSIELLSARDERHEHRSASLSNSKIIHNQPGIHGHMR
jgi:hypothetical protein